MANKVALAAALLVALVALASATTYTTTVTTTSYDREGSQKYQQCSQQVQGRKFRACQQYLQQRSGPYNGEEVEEEVLEMAVANPQQQYLQECCQQLKEMDRQQCGCEAIKQAVRQAQQGGRSYQTGQSEQIYQKARGLPSRCQLSEQQCRFSVVFV